MAKGDYKQTSTTRPDPTSEYYRNLAYESGAKALGLPGWYAAQAAQGGGGGSIMDRAKGAVSGGGSYGQRPGESYADFAARVNSGLSPSMAPILTPEQRDAQVMKFGVGQGGRDTMSFYRGLLADGGANPYESDVINRVMGDYGRLSDSARMNINDNATRAGAFGGSRHGVAEGVALGEIGRERGNAVAGLRYTGFNDAMQRRLIAAGIIPDLERDQALWSDPDMIRTMLAQRFLQGGPVGQDTTTPGNYYRDAMRQAQSGAQMWTMGG